MEIRTGVQTDFCAQLLKGLVASAPLVYTTLSLIDGEFCRKMPIVLPRTVVPLLPSVDGQEVVQYWSHLSAMGNPLAKISPLKNHIPLWIWGDEAQFRENGDEVLLIAIGSVLDQRKYSVEACYPLSICRSESALTFGNLLFGDIFELSPETVVYI